MRTRDPRRIVVTATVATSVRVLLAPQIRMLTERGYDTTVVTGDNTDGLASVVGDSELRTIAMKRAISPLADLVALLRWIRFLRETRPSAVVTFSPKASLLGLIAAKLTGVPQRVYSTGGLVLESASGIRFAVLWLTEWITCACATRVVANSPSLAQAYTSHRLTKSRKLSSTLSRKGVDAHHFDPQAPTDAQISVPGPLDAPVIGYVGRITPAKGLETLAGAIASVTAAGDPVRLLVVGDVEAGANDLLAALAASTRHFLATGPLRDVRPAYAAMDVLVLPTRREGFPNVVLEAAAMGVPAIVTDATGSRDSVTPSTGMIVPVDDLDALAKAIRGLCRGELNTNAMGLRARERAISEFEPSRVIGEQLDQMGLVTGNVWNSRLHRR